MQVVGRVEQRGEDMELLRCRKEGVEQLGGKACGLAGARENGVIWGSLQKR